jgi:hypothetical protein
MPEENPEDGDGMFFSMNYSLAISFTLRNGYILPTPPRKLFSILCLGFSHIQTI